MLDLLIATAFGSTGVILVIFATAKLFLISKVAKLGNPTALHVFVTGGSKGIGKAIAKAAVQDGACVTITARSTGPLAAAEKELRGLAHGSAQTVHSIAVDACDAAKVAESLAAAEAECGPVDVLVCNVGGSTQAPFEDLHIDDFEAQMRSNYLSAVYAIRCVVGGMKRRRRGRIVLVSSMAGQMGMFGYTAYSAAKFALRGFAEALQMELTPYSIRITVAYPPNTATEGFQKELLEMPEETHRISDSAGTFSPDEVGAGIWSAALAGEPQATAGMDGWLLARGTVGMAPETGALRVVQQVFLNGLLRLVSLGYLRYFDWIVDGCRAEREKLKAQ